MKDAVHNVIAIGAIAIVCAILAASFRYGNADDRELQKLKHCEEVHSLSSKGRDVLVVICDKP